MALIARHSPRPLRVADCDAPRCADSGRYQMDLRDRPDRRLASPHGQCLSRAGMPPIPAPFEHPCTRTSPSSDSSDTATGGHRRSRAPVAGAKV
jgi:hypothetical protein